MKNLEFATAQHLAGLVSRYFEQIAGTVFEFNEEPRPGDFLSLCRDFTHDADELNAAAALDAQIIEIARKILE